MIWLIGALALITGTSLVFGLPSPQGGAPGCLLMTLGGLVWLVALGMLLMG